MQTNLNINNQPAFKASVSDRFIKATHNYFNKIEHKPEKSAVFDKKVAEVFNDFGYDEFLIKHKKVNYNGKTIYTLSANKEGLSIPLTQKDKFRKIIEKFQQMTKYELYIKIKQFRHEHPELKQIKHDVKTSEL